MDGFDWDSISELITDLIYSEGQQVYSMEWDSGGPGAGAGRESVYAWQERYWISSSTFGISGGPFDTLEEALQGDLVAVTDATVSIECPLPDEDLIVRLHILAPQGHTVEINNSTYVVTNEQLQLSEGRQSSPSETGTNGLSIMEAMQKAYSHLTEEEIREASGNLV